MLGTIILAAGQSRRLGHPKQLVKLNGETLLDHSVAAATAVTRKNTVLVLGANALEILPKLAPSEAVIVQNQHWQEGIASSIRAGLQAMLDLYPDIDAIICMACDQPYADASVLTNLIAMARSSGKGIIVSSYSGTFGIPALFTKKYFPQLLALRGDEGAKKVLFQYQDDVAAVPFEAGKIDIDTEGDIKGLENPTC